MFNSPFFSNISHGPTSFTFKRALAGKAATDPIQQLFLDLIREYKQKSVDGKLVEPNAAIQKEMKTELEKLERQYGGGAGVDMTSFPSIKFEEPKLDPIDEPTAAPKKKKTK